MRDHRAAPAAAPASRREHKETYAEPPRPTMPKESSIEALLEPTGPVAKADRPRGRGKGCLIISIILIIVLGGAAWGGLWAWDRYGERVLEVLDLDGPHDYEEGEATGEALLTVVSGDTGEALSPRLHEAGVTLEADSFTRYLRENQVDLALYPGVYKLQQRMTSEAVVAAIEDPANRQEDTVQLREGLTVDDTLTRMADGLDDVSLEELTAAAEHPSDFGIDADSLEGWLFPATYTFDPGTSAHDAIAVLVDRTRDSLAHAGVPDDRAEEILTIASIIQREARFEDDFYKVSRVIANRLDPKTWGDTGGLLQMDSTAQYGYGESGTASTSKDAQHDDNPWNTYVHQGLPAGPIANPGDLAINAAMHPADGDWLYFVSVDLSTGETKFAETYAEHQKNVAQWHQWCRDNPDGGC